MEENPHDTFQYMERLLRVWLEHARLREIARLLELVGEELGRRGITLTSSTAPPLRGYRPRK